MDIKYAVKGGKAIKTSITKKIVGSYIFIIFSTLIVVGVVFGLLARFYAERQAMQGLTKDANAIFDIIINEEASNKDISSAAAKQAIRKKVLNQIGRMESNFTLISKDLKILYPRNEEAATFKQQILPMIQDKLNPKIKKTVSMKIKIDNLQYILVVLPPRNNVTQALKGWIVFYNPVEPIQKPVRSMLPVLLVSSIIAAVIAVVAGVFVARTIAKPIIMLKSRATALSKLDFDGSVEIQTGDELEELGKTINKMAVELKEYDIAQKRFFQNASHELKTPLMSIQGYAEGIKDGVFDNNEEALEIIIDESNRLKGIVEELIYLSKIESQENFYRFSTESMNEVIENSVGKLKGLSAKYNIRLNPILYKDARLNIDHDKITQALINIMGNCLRYAKSEINIITSNDGKWFEIKIQDNGEGFDKNESEKVFERFYKGKKGNSGLGLAITKVIIEKHHGSITASNHPGGGAEFQIRLPIVKD
ncbi:MAG: HAMP domain-containing histidine kinase [Clostridia bacterium]|nr:HAMP domain-containing histidine kinase [Clostridia bacterium]